MKRDKKSKRNEEITGTVSAAELQTKPAPELSQLETELKRVNLNTRFRKLLRSTVYTLIVVAAAAVLVAVLFMPVLRIYGSSMTPTPNKGEIVVSLKGSRYQPGTLSVFISGISF